MSVAAIHFALIHTGTTVVVLNALTCSLLS